MAELTSLTIGNTRCTSSEEIAEAVRALAREEIAKAMLIEKIELKGGDLIHVSLDDSREEYELPQLAAAFERAIEQARPQKDVAVLISDGSITLSLVRAGE